ncbi:MAG TPA: DinB family protein, partial [Thermoanaerobaculia bacterium]
MTLAELYLPDFDREMDNTRRILERVPTETFDYKPHEKSWAMGGLATHVANLPTWASLMIGNDSFDIAPPGQPPMRAQKQSTSEELLAYFETNAKSARASIEAATDEVLLGEWTLFAGP